MRLDTEGSDEILETLLRAIGREGRLGTDRGDVVDERCFAGLGEERRQCPGPGVGIDGPLRRPERVVATDDLIEEMPCEEMCNVAEQAR